MSDKESKFVITFQDNYPLEMVENMLATGFMGWGKAYRGDQPRVLVLYPFPHISLAKLKIDLDELRGGGELTYVEDSP